MNPTSSLRKSPRRAPAFGTILFIVLGLLVPVGIVGLTPAAGPSAWQGVLVIVVLSAARFAWTVSAGARHLVEMVICLFIYGFLGIAPLVQLRTGATPETTPGFVADFAPTTIAVILAGFVAMTMGSWFRAVRQRDQMDLAEQTVVPPPRLSAARVYAVTLVAFGLTIYYLGKLGVGSIVRPRAAFDVARAATWPDPTTAALVGGFTTMSLLVASVAQILLWRERRMDGKAPNLPVTLLTGLALLAVVNPVNSARYAVGTVYLALLAAFGIYASVRRYRVVATGALAALFLIFPLASTFRNTLDADLKLRNPLQSLTGGDFDSFDQINNAVYYVAVNGTTYGQQLLGVVFFWVPRSVWPDKAIDTGILLAEFRHYTFTNLSAPLWAELYINGGWVVLLVGMLLVGYFARGWDTKLDRQITLVGTPGIVGCILPFYSLILLRGSLLQATASLAVILVLAAFLSPRHRVDRNTTARSTKKEHVSAPRGSAAH